MILNTGHPLLAHADHAWFPCLAPGQGSIIPGLVERESGTLVGGPTWVDTPYGRGVRTDNLKYVDLNKTRVGAPATVFVAYTYRYDASTSGSATESGILLSAGLSGLSFRHNGTTVQALKSHVASLVSGTVAAPAEGEFHTAAFTVTLGTLPICTVYYDGNYVNSGTSPHGTALSGTNVTALGYDYNATTPEYGRHTILFAMWSGRRCYNKSEIYDLHVAARMRLAPLFIRTLPVSPILSDATGAVSKGLSFGGSFAPHLGLTHGLGLGATWGVSEIVGNFTHGISFGGSLSVEPTLSKGFSLGSTAKVDEMYAAIRKGLGLGIRTQSNSGDLANGRYRR